MQSKQTKQPFTLPKDSQTPLQPDLEGRHPGNPYPDKANYTGTRTPTNTVHVHDIWA